MAWPTISTTRRRTRVLCALVALGSLACNVDAGGGFAAGNSAGTPTSATAATASPTGDGQTTATDAAGTASATGVADTTAESTTDAPSGGPSEDSGTSQSTGNTATTATNTGGGDGMGACMGAPLDAQLEVPPLCEPTCTSIGFSVDCPLAGQICRLKDSDTAVCESCAPCGNLNAPCTASAQCDILFTCFMGQCTAMCDFNTPQTCGLPAACTDVGHPTHGVCDPTL